MEVFGFGVRVGLARVVRRGYMLFILSVGFLYVVLVRFCKLEYKVRVGCVFLLLGEGLVYG